MELFVWLQWTHLHLMILFTHRDTWSKDCNTEGISYQIKWF
jgi:hypothetical protein